MYVKMEKLTVLNPNDMDRKIIVFRDLKNKNKFTYRIWKNGHPRDRSETLSKIDAEALCKVCGVVY